MGRRALRKLDPALDLDSHLRSLEELPDSWRAAEWFCREAPLEIEIGSGKGLFMAAASQLRPTHDFVGVEVSAKYARFAAAKLARSQSGNAVMIHGDGLRFLREWVEDSSTLAVHVYFPDPWWKKRHRRRRILNVSFLRDVQRVLRTEGRLHFWTDVEEYFQTTLDLIDEEPNLVGPYEVQESPAEHDLDYRTHFERRTRIQREPVFRAEFVKR